MQKVVYESEFLLLFNSVEKKAKKKTKSKNFKNIQLNIKVTENKNFVLSEVVSRARIAYVLKMYRKDMGELCENEALSNGEKRSLKGKDTTVENFLRSYANYNVDGDSTVSTRSRCTL